MRPGASTGSIVADLDVVNSRYSTHFGVGAGLTGGEWRSDESETLICQRNSGNSLNLIRWTMIPLTVSRFAQCARQTRSKTKSVKSEN